jgi:hypothetical protein
MEQKFIDVSIVSYLLIGSDLVQTTLVPSQEFGYVTMNHMSSHGAGMSFGKPLMADY